VDEGKDAALADQVVRVELAAVRVDRLARDREPEPHSARIERAARLAEGARVTLVLRHPDRLLAPFRRNPADDLSHFE
jgi:hypothetical protein